MSKEKKVNLSRRDFMKGAALATSAGVLAGCAPKISASETPEAAVVTGSDVLTAEIASRKWSFEIAPDPIPDSDIANNVESEIIVVGAGTAGLCVACSAVENGAKVVLISASKEPVSRGGSNHAVYSKIMEREGYERYDPNVFLRKEMMAASYNIDQDKWWKFVNNSEEAMNWVVDKVEAAGYQCVLEGGYTDPGNEIMNMPTGAHAWIGEDYQTAGGGQPLLVKTLAKVAAEKGVEIVYSMCAKQLIREDNNTGRVSAVVAQAADGTYTKYVGTKAIVLATGDFSADKEMMAKYCPSVVDTLFDIQEVNYDIGLSIGGLFKGDGQKMGLWVGAAWQKTFPNCPMMLASCGPSPYDYSTHPGLMVNKNGYRFMNEDSLFALTANAQLHQPGKAIFAIWDSNYAEATKPWHKQGQVRGADPIDPAEIAAGWETDVTNGSKVKGNTIEEVINQLGLPLEKTLATINHYNNLCAAGVDSDYHKRAERLAPITQAPFYGAKSESPVFLTVLGGLRTNVNMQVCDANDDPIPGLYNVGTMVGDYYANLYNFVVEGNNYGANCITFGYMTGKGLAKGEI